MVGWDRYISSVAQRGNSLERLRLQNVLGEAWNSSEAIAILGAYQFKDGSWDYDPPAEGLDRIGSLGGTIHCLRWIREFSLAESSMTRRTLEFLEAIQSPDGSFYETEAKLKHSPQEWLQEETQVDRFYLTAAVPVRLDSLAFGNHAIVPAAVRWIASQWNDWDLSAGTWYNLWALLCLHPRVTRLADALYERCRAAAMRWIPDLPAQPLTWMLDAFQGASWTSDDPLVAKGLERLASFDVEGEFGAESDAPLETSVTALRLLREYDVP